MCYDLFCLSHHPLHDTWCQNLKIPFSFGDTLNLQSFTKCAIYAKVRHFRQLKNVNELTKDWFIIQRNSGFHM